MARIPTFMLILLTSTLFVHAQKSKVISVFQLIEMEKFKEAKTAVEEALEDENTRDWFRTWYAKGYLTHQAWQAGKKDKKLRELYPDQLYVAYESFSKAEELDKRGKLDPFLSKHYITLANELQEQGENLFKSGKYDDAFKSFNYALKISQKPLLSVKPDTRLYYNTAIAAYEGKDWENAIPMLDSLHELKYSVNTTHLLHNALIASGDTLTARDILLEGIENFKEDEELVLLLADLDYKLGKTDEAINILKKAALEDTSNFKYPYTRGIIYQKQEEYSKAIEAFLEAHEKAPKEHNVIVNIGLSYYNTGVLIDEKARTITNNRDYLIEKEIAQQAFHQAISWLEKARDQDPGNEEVNRKLYQLYRFLGMKEKAEEMEE